MLLPATLIVSLSRVNRGASVQGVPIEMPLGFAPLLGCITLVKCGGRIGLPSLGLALITIGVDAPV